MLPSWDDKFLLRAQSPERGVHASRILVTPRVPGRSARLRTISDSGAMSFAVILREHTRVERLPRFQHDAGAVSVRTRHTQAKGQDAPPTHQGDLLAYRCGQACLP